MMRGEMYQRPWTASLLLALIVVPALADDVHLTNGEVFEEVIAVEEGERVRVRLAYGELVLPRSEVLRIEVGRSPLAEYFEHRDRLQLAPESSAAQWLELALWAEARGLRHGFREALRQAADLDPRLEGLAAAMRRLGWVFDEARDRWLPYEEQARLAARQRAAAAPPERAPQQASVRGDSAVEERLSRAVEILALAQLEREANEGRRTADGRYLPGVHYLWPVATFGGWVFPKSPHDQVISDPVSHTIHRPADPGAREIIRSQPGSLLPIRSGEANHGGVRRY